jgi:hypothetical protein
MQFCKTTERPRCSFRTVNPTYDANLSDARASKMQLLKAPRNYDAILQNGRTTMTQPVTPPATAVQSPLDPLSGCADSL